MQRPLIVWLGTLAVSSVVVTSLAFGVILITSPESADLPQRLDSRADAQTTPSDQPNRTIPEDTSLYSNEGVQTIRYFAGTGIAISRQTISNIDPGSNQEIFKHIAVADQDTISAESNNDTLTIKAGDGISLSNDATGKILTITNNVTSVDLNGWNGNQNLVQLSDTSNDVAIGGSSSLGKVSIFGTNNEKQLVLRGASDQTSNLLELQNNAGAALATFSDAGMLSLPSNGLSVGSDQLIVSNGRVGIGTTSPNATLDVDGDINISSNNNLTLTANTPDTGNISRLITLKATSKYDRPWISGVDYTGRHAAAFGIHHTNKTDEQEDKTWEIKTSADPNGSQPSNMITRLAIEYDSDLADVIFGDIDTIGIHNDYGDRIEYVAQMRDSGDTGSYAIGQWITELGAGDSTLMSFDTMTLTDDADATLRFFRETNTTGQRRLVIMKGDGTSTETFTVNADTGQLRVLGDGEGAFFGSGANSAAYNNFQSNRTMVGYDGSYAVLQGGTSKGIKLNVNNSSFGQGTVLTVDPSGDIDVTNHFDILTNGNGLSLGDGTNTGASMDFAGDRTAVGYDGSYAVLQGGTNKGIKLNVNNSSFGQGTAVTIESDGDVGLGVTPTLGPLHLANGAYVTSGGTWTNASDRNLKTELTSVDGDVLLDRLAQVPISEWRYLREATGIRHIGPMAQDFYEAFGWGNNNTSISTIDTDGLALATIQALYSRLQKVEAAVQSSNSPLQEFHITQGWYLDQSGHLTTDQPIRLNEALTVEKKSLFNGEAFFNQASRFLAEVVFENPVRFLKPPTFTQDSAGTAIIKAGSDLVRVSFKQAYASPPQVTTSKLIQSEQTQADNLNTLISYALKDVSEYGFTIQLNQATSQDLAFSWIAIATNHTSLSIGESPAAATQAKNIPTGTPSSSPEPTQSQSSSPSAEITPVPEASDSRQI